MITFVTDVPEIESELRDEIRLFFPYGDERDLDITHSARSVISGDIENVTCRVTVDGRVFDYESEIPHPSPALVRKRLFKRAAKLAVYSALKECTGVRPPWGSLTGIRPSKLVYDLLDDGKELGECAALLTERFDVSPEKADLICRIVENQRGIYTRDVTLFDLYVHIPFCVTKCSYCSFATELLLRSMPLVPAYVEALRTEIGQTLDLIAKYGRLHTVYVGGGTPTALDAAQLERLLGGMFGGVEFTVEAGRPDTISEDKLAAIKRVGATRICVNPQTLNDATLERIGRAHTAAEFFDKFALARKFGFDINVDLIAGLPGETTEDFARSIAGVAALRPENVTVHTLSRKNGSTIVARGERTADAGLAAMTDLAGSVLGEKGYIPYYLYRQKQMVGNLENVGYCLPGKQCVNNITVMEDCISVLGCGAGAISKAVTYGEKRIVRLANLRDVRLYLERSDEKAEEKRIFCQKQFTKS